MIQRNFNDHIECVSADKFSALRTAQILASELSNIFVESKKKYPEIRGHAEKSSQELKSLPHTSETQIAGDLRRRLNFVTPLLQACRTANPKLALPAVTCLQRLIISQGLAPERLAETLDSLGDALKISFDIQLKILQCLPSLLQYYSRYLEGDLQAKVVEICLALQQVKSAPISSTASATLQQVVSSLFERVEREDDRSTEGIEVVKVKLDGKDVQVKPAAYDAFRVFQDICLLLEGQKPRFFKSGAVPQAFGLELIESVLTNNGELIETHDELAHLLRTRVMPLITRLLSEQLSFAISVRTLRLLCVIFRVHLEVVEDDLEIALGLLDHMLDAEGPGSWRRALCMEIFRILYSVPNLITTIYARFDQRQGRRNVVQDNLSLFVRLAAERPALIGLGQQSTYPAGTSAAKASSQEQAVLEASGISGVIPGELGVAETNVPGISSQWSSMKVSCLEQLDKNEPPAIPDTYVYSLVLICLTNLSDGLAKVVLPLTAPSSKAEKRTIPQGTDGTADAEVEQASEQRPARVSGRPKSRTVPMNPLTLTGHPSLPLLETIASLIDTSWPAILATSSTFLNAALDSEFYRGLIRCVQRFVQLAGLLRLSTPRDAFMTTLAKSAVPAYLQQTDYSVPSTPSLSSPRLASGQGSEGFFGAVPNDVPANRSHSRRSSLDHAGRAISQRNLMCLRALINVAIAVGPILDQSWPIVIETLQKADSVLAQSGNAMAREYRASANGPDGSYGNPQDGASLSNEISAVEGAITRLFASTEEYPSEAFLPVLRALCSLVGEQKSQHGNFALMPGTPMLNRRSPSAQSFGSSVNVASRNVHFALAKLGDLARTNVTRLVSDHYDSGWSLLIGKLLQVATMRSYDHTARLMAADVLATVTLDITVATLGEDLGIREEVQLRALGCLESEVRMLLESSARSDHPPASTDLDVHRSVLEAVKAILEECGDSLAFGWRSIFAILQSSFTADQPLRQESDDGSTDGDEPNVNTAPERATKLRPISTRLARAGFECMQLICSDFLPSLKRSRIVLLLDLLSLFASQKDDVNISLTTLGLFWTVSDFLKQGMSSSDQSISRPARIGDDGEIRALAEQGSIIAIWMLLLSKLSSSTEDDRINIKTGVMHTVFRILGSSTGAMDEGLWHFVHRDVILTMLRTNLLAYSDPNPAPFNDSADTQQLASSTLFSSLADFWTTNVGLFAGIQGLQAIWQGILDLLGAHLLVKDAKLQATVYTALASIVSTPVTPIQAAFELWGSHKPHVAMDDSDADPMNEAMIAYVRLGRRLYALLDDKAAIEGARQIASILADSIAMAPLPAYVSDVDIMTGAQGEAIDFYSELRRDTAAVASIVDGLSTIMLLPRRADDRASKRNKPTFIAVSKRAMMQAEKALSGQTSTLAAPDLSVLSRLLDAYSTSICERYVHRQQGKDPSMWRTAADSAVRICQSFDIEGICNDKNESRGDVPHSLVTLSNSLRGPRRADLPPLPELIKDETFDLQALSNIRQSLGISLEADEKQLSSRALQLRLLGGDSRLSYAQCLFRNSLFHEVDYNIPNDPLHDLYHIRAGRVHDPPFHPRIRICYASLDEMFALAKNNLNAPSGGGAEEFPIASTIIPLLVLRCAIPLKRYVADQPLRGRMPTPTSQRLELLYMLNKMGTLDIAVLKKLLPLVGKASTCARADTEVADALNSVHSRVYDYES